MISQVDEGVDELSTNGNRYAVVSRGDRIVSGAFTLGPAMRLVCGTSVPSVVNRLASEVERNPLRRRRM